MEIVRAIVFTLYLICSFILLNIGFVIYDNGNEPIGWLLIITGIVNIVVGLFRKIL